MIKIKSPEEIKKMRLAGKLGARVLQAAEEAIRPGISTEDLDVLVDRITREAGATSAPYGYHGFPKHICTSVNDVVCHGIPSAEVILRDGDIVNVDITVKLDGYHGDTSRTFLVGKVSSDASLLVNRTENAMYRGISAVKAGRYLSEVGKTIEKYISKFGYSIVRAYTGHGIGNQFHEEPVVFHHNSRANRIRMRQGMIFTVEPMINAGKSYKVNVSSTDGWTAKTADGSLSAQFEHTVLVTENGFEILTSLSE